MTFFRYCSLLFLLLISFLSGNEFAPDLTVMIPMRDGAQLATDLYLPTPDARALPCILVRSPAGRQQIFGKDFIVQLAKEGYIVAIQETRSASDTEGKTLPFISDGWGALQDGYDTVEWLAKSPYTNGKIGTWGASALGITQLLLAPSRPPHLKCQYILVAASSLYHHGLFPGGQLLKNQTEGWLGLYACDTGVFNFICQRPFYNDFWKQFNSLEMPERVTVPGMHIGGWYDTFLQGTLDAFQSRQYHGGDGARNRQKLIIGPWTHFWPLSKHFGDFLMPKEGESPPWDISPLKWFDHYLKGIPNKIDSSPAVTYFVMGPFDGTPSSGNVWRTSNVWPIPSTPTSFYFTSTAQLQRTIPDKGQLSFHYDPREVIPTIGGNNLFLESGPKDQCTIESRPDVLVFTSEKLPKEMEVTGSLSATLFFSSDQQDTDVVVRLCDVYPDGRSILIAEGSYRLGVMHYQSQNRKSYLPHTIYPVKIALGATSFVFAKDHAIRVSISSSSYPRYEKNMNVGFFGTNSGKYNLAKNTIYFGGKSSSYIQLPVVYAHE